METRRPSLGEAKITPLDVAPNGHLVWMGGTEPGKSAICICFGMEFAMRTGVMAQS